MVKPLRQINNLLRFSRGAATPVTGPLKADWEIVNTCNARCATCRHWQAKRASNLLTTVQGESLIKQLAESGLVSLCFTGGEPLLRRDLPRLIAYAKSQRLSTSLVSNGLLITERKAVELINAGLDTIFISLDAADARLNDELRGLSGYTKLALEAIDNLKALRRNSGPRIFIKATISQKNADQLVKLAELVSVKGVEGLSFQLAQIAKSAGFEFDEALLLTRRSQDIFLEQLDQLVHEHREILAGSLEYYESLRDYLQNPETAAKYRPATGFFFVHIDGQGNLFSSPLKEHRIGNILQQPFEVLWYSQRASQVRSLQEQLQESGHLFDSLGSLSVELSHFSFKNFFKLTRPILDGGRIF